MGRLVSLLTVMVLLAMAVMWLPAGNSEQQLVEVTEIATRQMAGGRDMALDGQGGTSATRRSFSPERPLFIVSAKQVASRAAPSVVSSSIASFSGSSVEAIGSSLADSTYSLSPSGLVAAAETPIDQVSLVRRIQAGLKDAGCYWGEIDGDWGPGSRRAMRQYMRAVNASLPTSEPEEILLQLIKRNTIEDCMPPAIVAHRRRAKSVSVAATKTKPRIPDEVFSVPAPQLAMRPQAPHVISEVRPPLPGRMAVGAVPSSNALLDGSPSLTGGVGTDVASTLTSQPRNVGAARRVLQQKRSRRERASSGEVIVYSNAARLGAAPRRSVQPRRATRRQPRDVYQTAWARRAFNSGE